MKKCPFMFNTVYQPIENNGKKIFVRGLTDCIGAECAAYRERQTSEGDEWKCMMFPQGEWVEVKNEN